MISTKMRNYRLGPSSSNSIVSTKAASMTSFDDISPQDAGASGWRIDPEKDGIEHINIHPKGKSWLGVTLSSFARTPFIHPVYGPFNSMEGFSHWISTGKIHDELRALDGDRALRRGRLHRMQPIENFRAELAVAHYYKVATNPTLLAALKDSTLPFTSYYRFGKSGIPIRVKGHEWIVPMVEDLRDHFKTGRGYCYFNEVDHPA